MVQVADLYAWIVRRYAEIVEYERTEEFSGEAKFIDDRVKMLRKRRLGVQCVGLRDPPVQRQSGSIRLRPNA